MTYKIRFTPEAEETYKYVVNQLKDRWGVNFVSIFEDQVLKSISVLYSNPRIHPIVEENTQIRKCTIHKNCAMLYRVFDDYVLIVCFWDNRQEPILY